MVQHADLTNIAARSTSSSVMKGIRKLVGELFRRKVVRVMGAYIAIFWLLATGFGSLFPTLGVPAWVLPVFVVAGIALIPVLTFLTWKFDLVPPQLVRDPRDVQPVNPALGWAMLRHETADAGHLLLSWTGEGGVHCEKRFFQPVSIGREPGNDIEFADQRVSRYHAVLWAEAGFWRVRDLESANGTYLDEARIKSTAPLPQSCALRFHPDGPTVHVYIATNHETLVSP
jgi:hypothetical protein